MAIFVAGAAAGSIRTSVNLIDYHEDLICAAYKNKMYISRFLYDAAHTLHLGRDHN